MPPSSAVSSPSLQQLSKVTVLPSRCSALPAALAFLDKIDHVEINGTTERSGVVYYQLGVFLKHKESHLPTIKTAKVADRPDYRLERRFSNFTSLRYEVWYHAQQQHHDGHRCKYCGDFMHYIVHSMSQPRLLVRVATSVSTRKRLLEKFCNVFVKKTLGHVILQHNTACIGYQYIPHIVECFFRQHEA